MKLAALFAYYAALFYGIVRLNGGWRATLRNWNWEHCELCKKHNIPKADPRSYCFLPVCAECDPEHWK